MKLNLSKRAQMTLLAVSVGLAMLPAGVEAFPSPQWMQGGHSARITGLACSPDGSMIASASEDGTIKIWSTNGTLLSTLTPKTCPITAIAWSPDSRKIAGGGYIVNTNSNGGAGRGMTYLWQAPSGWTADNVSLTRFNTNRFGYITALAFSTDGAQIACGCSGGSNLVYSLANGALAASRPAYNSRPSAVTSVAFSSSGLMASGCEDASIRVYESSWTLLWNSATNADAHTTNVTGVAFSPDGSLVASASLDQTIKIWSTTSWTQQRTLTGHTNGVASVAFSPDGQKIVSGSMDGIIKVWDLTGACLLTVPAHALPVTAAIFSTDGARIVSASDDSTVRIWSVTDGAAVCTLGGRNYGIGPVAFSPDGLLCASAGADQTIQVRHAGNGTLVRTLPGNTNYFSSLAFSPDSTTLASGGGPLDSNIKLWRISDGALLRTIAATTNGVMALAWAPDGSTLASGGDSVEQTINVWNAADGTLRQTLAGHTNGVTALVFSPDGNLLASGGRRFDHTIKVWAVANGALVNTLTGHANNIEALAFAPSGSLIASGSSGNNNLKVWQLSNSSVRNFGTNTNPVSAVAFSPDGGTLASSDGDSIKFWNVSSGMLSETVTQNAYRVTSLAFSPNGNLFIYGREDATILLSTNTYGARGQPPLVFSAFAVKPVCVDLEASVQPLTHYVIQSSTNLTDWSFLTRAVSESNSMSIPGLPTSNAPARFHRALTPP
jgi:WD40 repeat protein